MEAKKQDKPLSLRTRHYQKGEVSTLWQCTDTQTKLFLRNFHDKLIVTVCKVLIIMIIITFFPEIPVLCLVSLHVTVRIQCIYEDNIQVKSHNLGRYICLRRAFFL